MCPYCGEDVPADTTRCWKCGTEISPSEGGGEDPGGIEERPTPEGKTKKKPTQPCPHCEAPVSIYALRCNECGRSIGRPGRRINWAKASWVAFGVVSVGLLVGLVYAFITSRPENEDRGRFSRRGDPIVVSWIELERIYFRPTDKAHEERRAERWRNEYKGEFVHWQGVIVRADEATGVLELTDGEANRNPDEPQVRLTLKDPGLVKARGLKRGTSLAYSARLQTYLSEEKMVELDDGTIREDE